MMKIRNYIWLFIGLAMFALAGFVFTSCETEPPRPDCEIHNYGSVTVRNSTGYNIWVDVTWGNVYENYEKLLYNGNSYRYNEIPAGGIEIWLTFDNIDWLYEYENLSTCEDMEFTWYLNARKSGCPFLLDIGNGQLVEPKPRDKK